jgi:hypothetical protein
MILFVLSSALIGTMLGRRFTVLALIPAMICALIIAGANIVMGEETFGATIMRLAMFLICVQLGYLGGAAIEFSLQRRGRILWLVDAG